MSIENENKMEMIYEMDGSATMNICLWKEDLKYIEYKTFFLN